MIWGRSERRGVLARDWSPWRSRPAGRGGESWGWRFRCEGRAHGGPTSSAGTWRPPRMRRGTTDGPDRQLLPSAPTTSRPGTSAPVPLRSSGLGRNQLLLNEKPLSCPRPLRQTYLIWTRSRIRRISDGDPASGALLRWGGRGSEINGTSRPGSGVGPIETRVIAKA